MNKINKSTSGNFLRLILFGLFLLLSSSAFSAVWYVNKTGNDTLNGKFVSFSTGKNGPKLTISAALTIANAGDSVVVGKGYYNESVTFTKDVFLVIKNISIKNVSMNGPSAHCFILGDTLDITNSLDLTDGIIKPFFSTMRFRVKRGAAINGGSQKSYVEGRLYRSAKKGAGLLSFPVGLAGNYRPSFITFTDTTTDTVYHWGELHNDSVPVPEILPTGIRNISKVSYWTFGREGIGASKKYIFFLAYDSVAKDDEVFEPVELKSCLSVKKSGPWKNLSGAGSASRIGFQETAIPSDTLGYVILANTKAGYNPLGHKIPFARFSYTGNCLGDKFKFFDESKNMLPRKIKKWRWDFGDLLKTNDTSNIQNPTYTYTAVGNYKVKLRVTNDTGNVDSITKDVYVHALPKGSINVSEVCFGGETLFNDNSSVAKPDSLVFASWSFGDSKNATGFNVKHTYLTADSFNVFMVVTSSAGCGGSAKAKAYVNKYPKADFGVSSDCFGDTSYFNRVKSIILPEKNIQYSWYVKNKLLAVDTMLKKVFDSAMDFKIMLIARSNKGCADTVSKTHRIYGLPLVSFQLDKTVSRNDSLQCLSTNKFSFVKNISAPQGQLFNAAWKWGDGSTGIITDFSHSYIGLGTYNVKLTTITDQGCIDSFDSDYVVRGFVTPKIAKIGQCQPDSIVFYDSMSISTSSIVSYLWKLPSGGIKTGNSVKDLVTSNGPLYAKVIITNKEGCIDSVSRSFNFVATPVLTFNIVKGALPFCPGDSITIKANGGNSVLWKADSDTSRTKTFKSAGNYVVKASNSAACNDVDSFQVVLYKAAVITTSKDTSIARGRYAMLSAKGGVTYTWSPGSTLNKTSSTPVKATPTVTTSYVVSGTDGNGCAGKDTVKVTVVEPLFIRIPNLITPNGDGENDFWVISELKDLDKYDLTITDYQGKITYESTNYKNDWNASKNGTKEPDGIYYYKLKNRSSEEVIKGFIQVIR